MLDLLRKGIKDSGCHFKLAYFKPESDLNEEHRRLYNGNIFSVVRQLHYSKKEPLLSLDLALFLNGFPVVTAELKNPLKRQNVQDAVKQYRDTRNQNEPLFKLGRCFAHFAVDPDLVFMDSYRIQQTSSGKIALADEEGKLGPSREPENFSEPEEELTPLSIIIQEINERFGDIDFTDADRLRYFSEDMERRLVENENLARAANPKINTKDNFKLIYNDYFDDVLNDMGNV